jgi:hypothetical protein
MKRCAANGMGRPTAWASPSSIPGEVGTAEEPMILRQPAHPNMDPDWAYATDDLEQLERGSAWRRIFTEPIARPAR